MIYLASPYTDEDHAVMEDRYAIVRDVTATLLARGEVIFSPIVHCHELAKYNDLPRDVGFWWRYNSGMISVAKAFAILTLDDWKESKGVRKEYILAQSYTSMLIALVSPIAPHIILHLDPEQSPYDMQHVRVL